MAPRAGPARCPRRARTSCAGSADLPRDGQHLAIQLCDPSARGRTCLRPQMLGQVPSPRGHSPPPRGHRQSLARLTPPSCRASRLQRAGATRVHGHSVPRRGRRRDGRAPPPGRPRISRGREERPAGVIQAPDVESSLPGTCMHTRLHSPRLQHKLNNARISSEAVVRADWNPQP